jgi:hypothetical protein
VKIDTLLRGRRPAGSHGLFAIPVAVDVLPMDGDGGDLLTVDICPNDHSGEAAATIFVSINEAGSLTATLETGHLPGGRRFVFKLSATGWKPAKEKDDE